MDQSIAERPKTEAEKLLAFHPSTKALPILMTETPSSSQIAAWGYDEANKTLRVRFKFGLSEYDYHHVSPEKAKAMAEAKSLGTFLGAELKGVHHYEQTKERQSKR